jgi:Flp pilus assembly pilin Flp
MFHSFWNAFWHEEDGQDLVEYALILAFIGLAAIAMITSVGNQVNTIWTNVNTQLKTAPKG